MTAHLTTKQAAARLGVTTGRVVQLIHAGKIPATKVGRDWIIDETAVEAAKGRPDGRRREDRMKTEHDYGREYAEWLKRENQPGAESVDIDEMLGGSVDIPPGDYSAMVGDGIDNPDPRMYWEGFNSVFE